MPGAATSRERLAWAVALGAKARRAARTNSRRSGMERPPGGVVGLLVLYGSGGAYPNGFLSPILEGNDRPFPTAPRPERSLMRRAILLVLLTGPALLWAADWPAWR